MVRVHVVGGSLLAVFPAAGKGGEQIISVLRCFQWSGRLAAGQSSARSAMYIAKTVLV